MRIWICVFILVLTPLVGCSPGDPLPDTLYTSDIIPGSNSTYDLGSNTTMWRAGYFHDLHVENATLYIGGLPWTGEGLQGPSGPEGPTGPPGEQGVIGPSGPNEVTVSTETTLSGLLMGDYGKSGTISEAAAGVDYAIPEQLHSHSNKATLDSISEALKTSYDWLVTNITSTWKDLVDSHITDVSNPHSVTANQVLPSQEGQTGKFLTTDGSTPSWSVPADGNGIDIRAGTVTTNGGTTTVIFNTPFPNTDYAIALTAISGTDTVVCMWGNKTVNDFSVTTQDDGGKTETGVEVLWIAIPYNNP